MSKKKMAWNKAQGEAILAEKKKSLEDEIDLYKQKTSQGNKPGDDPQKYGLKFDGGKSRWDLVPMKELLSIIEVPGRLLKEGDLECLTVFNKDCIYNKIMNLIINNTVELFPMAGFYIFFLLRGKAYSLAELMADTNICRWDLFDINEIQKVVDVYSYGAALYSDNNWKLVAKERYYSALLRHFKTVRTKERFDGESGFLHLHHAIWNVLALLWMENNKKDAAV